MRGVDSFNACVHTGTLSDWNRCMAANFSSVCIVLNTSTLFKSASSLKWCTWPIVFNENTSTTSWKSKTHIKCTLNHSGKAQTFLKIFLSDCYKICSMLVLGVCWHLSLVCTDQKSLLRQESLHIQSYVLTLVIHR